MGMLGKQLASLVLLLLLTASTQAEKANFVASRLRLPFHFVSCYWAGKITAEHAVYFETREEAVAGGHRPCKICKP